jgi:hypothetical protein
MYELQPKHSFTICCPLTDEGTDVVCPNCNFINDNLSIKPDGTVESKDYVPPSDDMGSEASISSHDTADRDNNLWK